MNEVKLISIYLPAYHQIPENDSAWGVGFTEWVNVRGGKAFFENHFQPFYPDSSVGFYDLSEPEEIFKQIHLAIDYGIYGFAFYHYWFNGKLIFSKPIMNMLNSSNDKIPFCLIWANENWSKRWNGSDEDIILEQKYSFEDDITHIKWLCENIFSSDYYIKIDDKPVFIIYRAELLPNIKETVAIWKNEVKRYGYPGIYLIRMNNFDKTTNHEFFDFDATLDFGPDWSNTGEIVDIINKKKLYDYPSTVYNIINKKYDFKYFNTVFPSWDNSSRRIGLKGSIFINNDPSVFKLFLETLMYSTIKRFEKSDERILFINAWNEWGEGCCIEPNAKYGFKYLEICRSVEPKKISEYELYSLKVIKNYTDIIGQRKIYNQKKNKLFLNLDYKIRKLLARCIQIIKM